jgi:nitrogen fixation NifU-like protein
MYSAELLDHFQNPRNVGEVPGADVRVQVENPACGDVLQLSLKLLDGRIAAVAFRAKGCVPAIACGSKLTDMLCGKTPAEARGLRRDHLIVGIGGLPEASIHASHLAMDALRAALDKLAAGQGDERR